MILDGFFRSSASWRVRIALNLKGLTVESRTYRLRAGDQRQPAYLAINPQGLVPALTLDDGTILTQSLAICEYLDEQYPDPPLLPGGKVGRARARALAQVIACDVHPLQNLKILQRLEACGLDEEAVNVWARTTIDEGLEAFEALLGDLSGPFCCGETPGLADLCLIPQLGNARRFGVDLRWPKIAAIEAQCKALPAFADAVPERQPDAQ